MSEFQKRFFSFSFKQSKTLVCIVYVNGFLVNINSILAVSSNAGTSPSNFSAKFKLTGVRHPFEETIEKHCFFWHAFIVLRF